MARDGAGVFIGGVAVSVGATEEGGGGVGGVGACVGTAVGVVVGPYGGGGVGGVGACVGAAVGGEVGP
jgi:hypothetical protein